MAYGRIPPATPAFPPLHCKSNGYLKQQDSASRCWTAIYGKAPALQYTTGGQRDYKGRRLQSVNCVWIFATRYASEEEAERQASFS